MLSRRAILRALAGAAGLLLFLGLLWPTPYRHARWAGVESRVSRFTSEQTVQVPWTLAPGADEHKTRAFCAACHGQRKLDLTKPHEHKLWVAVAAEPPAGKEDEALRDAVAAALPPHSGRSVQIPATQSAQPRAVTAEIIP